MENLFSLFTSLGAIRESLSVMLVGIVNFFTSNLGGWYLVLVNFFGVLAMTIKVSEYQFKKRRARILIFSLASLCWATYFFVQGQTVGALANIIGLIQGLVFMQRDKHNWAKSPLWLVLFLALHITSCTIGLQFWHDLFPFVGSVIGAISYYVIDEKKYRYLVLFSMCCWVCNSAFKMPSTTLALINDSTCIISSIIGLVRFYKREKAERMTQEVTQTLEKTNKDVAI